MSYEQETLKSFMNEILLMVECEHKNIVKFYGLDIDYEEKELKVYYIMEYIEWDLKSVVMKEKGK